MAAALASHLTNLRTAFLSLKATGAKGFEGLIGVALAEVADAPFRLAGSGSQFGLDGPTSYKGDGLLYECKRYKSNVPRSDRLREIVVERRRFGYGRARRRLRLWFLRSGSCRVPLQVGKFTQPRNVPCRPLRSTSHPLSQSGQAGNDVPQLHRSLSGSDLSLAGKSSPQALHGLRLSPQR